MWFHVEDIKGQSGPFFLQNAMCASAYGGRLPRPLSGALHLDPTGGLPSLGPYTGPPS